ncbi:DNA repair protein XRCC4-like [Asterias rubens]|uniref:DNA repair protein XRCC4-like n=1 Tax=Asterias rubens TaxID=7604 RepID=UPI0014555145|nr:DNA repair protein XRCC4-like [Asterias rubens]
MSNRSLCRIDVGRQPYFLQTTLREGGKDGFDLVITDTINSWEGKLSLKRLEKLAKEVNMDLQEFIEQTKKALTRQNIGDLAFEYQMKPSDGSGSEFSWKKVMTSGNIKFQLGSLSLEVAEDPSEAIQELFIFTIQNAASLRENINVLEGENEKLSTERANALKRLEKCVNLHSEMEQELFSKFQVVLNDKKAKIRRLKQEVKDAISNAESASSHLPTRDTSHPSLNSSGEESNEDDLEDEELEDDEISTDEESKSRHKPKKRTVQSSRVEADTSLILGDDEPTNETAAPMGKRRKRRAVTSKQTPSKPAIPKVLSGRTERSATPSTPGTSEISRLSQRTSSKSSKSDPDPDMLFDEL